VCLPGSTVLITDIGEFVGFASYAASGTSSMLSDVEAVRDGGNLGEWFNPIVRQICAFDDTSMKLGTH
jgi:hypothetical protein